MPNVQYRGGFDFIEQLRGGGTTTFNESLLGVVGTKEEMAVLWKAFLQDQLDFRQSLNTLPGGSPDNRDPDRTTDPAKPWLFWDPPQSEGGGNLNSTFLVGRADIVESVVWTGSEYRVTVRRAQQ